MKRSVIGIIVVVALVALALLYPSEMLKGAGISGKYALEMVLIFPAVLVLMGLADVWIPQNAIEKHLGNRSGVRGVLLSIFLGTLPTGPVYMAFPIASELIKKNASVTNIMIFLGVWASLKIPQIGMEIQFLGIKFAALRFFLTLATVLVTGFFIGYMERKHTPDESLRVPL